MTIEREPGFGYVLRCDECDETVDFPSFEEAVEGKKDLGWKSRKADGEWSDVCPDCQDE